MRKPNEDGVPNIDLICDYLNAETSYSEIHRRLLKLMCVNVISSGRVILDEEKIKSRKKRVYVRRK